MIVPSRLSRCRPSHGGALRGNARETPALDSKSKAVHHGNPCHQLRDLRSCSSSRASDVQPNRQLADIGQTARVSAAPDGML